MPNRKVTVKVGTALYAVLIIKPLLMRWGTAMLISIAPKPTQASEATAIIATKIKIYL